MVLKKQLFPCKSYTNLLGLMHVSAIYLIYFETTVYSKLAATARCWVEAEENAMQRAIPAVARVERALLENKGCDHRWLRIRGNLGNCENCNYSLPCYGMRCVSDCEATFCFTLCKLSYPKEDGDDQLIKETGK